MIRLRAKIQFPKNSDGAYVNGRANISFATSTIEGSNISAGATNEDGKWSLIDIVSSNIVDIFAQNYNGKNPFILGTSKLGGGEQGDSATYERKSKAYIGTVSSNNNGDFSKNYEIKIGTSSGNEIIRAFTIVFDTTRNQYPTSIEVNGKTYENSSPYFHFFGDELSTHTIKISNWNKPNSPLVIQTIYSALDIIIDLRNMISLNSRIIDRSDIKMPSWGIISNTGDIDFKELYGEIEYCINENLITQGSLCSIILEDTLSGRETGVATFYTDTWDYDDDDKTVMLSLKDDLEEWQDINVNEIPYDPIDINSKPFSWFYEYLWKLTSNRSSYVNSNGETIIGTGSYNMLSILELDEDTKSVLNNTYIQYPLLEKGNLWQQWTKLCQVCQLHIYKNNNGVVVCRYNGGN